MLDRFVIQMRNLSFFFCIFCTHLYKKWNPDKEAMIGLCCMFISSIIFPIVVCTLFIQDPSYLEQTIFIYMAVTIWSISILILINQRIFNRLKSEALYVFRLIRFIIVCHSTFLNQYKKWVKYHLHRPERHAEFEKYDLCVVDTILMQVCSLYFSNINTKLEENIPFVVSADRIKELNADKQFKNFYSSIFFNIEEKEEKCTLDIITIKIFDAVMGNLYTKSWFEEYWENEAGCRFIRYIINNWFDNIGYFNTYKLMEYDNSQALSAQ